VPGVAVMVAAVPAHTVDELTDTVGNALTVTVPLAKAEEQVVAVLVITTLYVPATVEVKVATLPGLVTPAGTVQT
jgi:hypothetical protein